MIAPQPSIYLYTLRIDEPITVLTDLLVSAVCFYAFLKLKNANTSTLSRQYLRNYFFLLAIATCLGGLAGHAFLYALSFAWKLPGWVLSMFAVMFIERSAITYARPYLPGKLGKWLAILNIIELILVMSITLFTLDFKWVEFHSGYGLVGIVLPLHSFVYYKSKDPASLGMILAVGIASIAALVFMYRLSIHTWFNYLDASHVLMALAAYVFFRSSLLISKR